MTTTATDVDATVAIALDAYAAETIDQLPAPVRLALLRELVDDTRAQLDHAIDVDLPELRRLYAGIDRYDVLVEWLDHTATRLGEAWAALAGASRSLATARVELDEARR